MFKRTRIFKVYDAPKERLDITVNILDFKTKLENKKSVVYYSQSGGGAICSQT